MFIRKFEETNKIIMIDKSSKRLSNAFIRKYLERNEISFFL